MAQSQPPSAGASVAARSELVPGRIFQLDLAAPRVAAAARAGHFVIIQATARSERLSLPVAAIDAEAGRLSVVFDATEAGFSGLAKLAPGAGLAALMGPIGKPSQVEGAASVLLVGEGPPAFGLVPVARAMRERGSRLAGLLAGDAGCRKVLAERLDLEGAQAVSGDDGGDFSQRLSAAVSALSPDLVLAAGPLPLLRAVQEFCARAGVAARLRLSPSMLDGVGMCGGCRVKVAGKLALCCLEGAEFEAPGVDFDYLECRERACRAAQFSGDGPR